MSKKLTDENVELISKLAVIQNNRSDLNTRLNSLTKKVELVKKAIASDNEQERQIIDKLKEQGLMYGDNFVESTPVTNNDAKDRLFSLFNEFMASKTTTVQVPTSAPQGSYSFPDDKGTPTISPTSGPPLTTTLNLS